MTPYKPVELHQRCRGTVSGKCGYLYQTGTHDSALRTLNHTSESYVMLKFFWSPDLHCGLLHSSLSNAADHQYQITVELKFLFTYTGYFVLGLPGSLMSSTLSQKPPWNSHFIRSLDMACLPQSYTHTHTHTHTHILYIYVYTGCPGRNVPDFERMFLTLKYTNITQNTYIRS